ncbi:helicase Cas3 [Posidoniimonas corsicana]|uniref:Helicase Cas3 n=1 Tax=Posidoniimonas corsicana TaxID=1938618 RepID=A0A5C5VCA9_9BACT|nr:CRISPR-associated helicase Cas3' [Posidoniimonas corsicana]TWT35607.1 helicase Cas3 [Posidoniimonas corsicana]
MRYAHTLPEQGPERWEPIESHLRAVSDCATGFAAWLCPNKGGCAEWGRVAGLWHDLGKYSDAFQAMLQEANGFEAHLEQKVGRVDHSTAGAKYAKETAGQFSRLLSYVIAGHHAGLANNAKLSERLDKPIPGWKAHVEPELLEPPQLGTPGLTVDRDGRERFAFQCAFFTRMLFSCLIDADRIETERFCAPDLAEQRLPPAPLQLHAETLDAYLDTLGQESESTEVNRHRQDILKACWAASERQPGLFSLTVPTGGGKTLASLAFALRHAGRHGLRRVVMAIPFTSIIEQTVDVYRRVFDDLGEGVVLEHHSNLDPDQETRSNRLAAENWDAPLVVTTNVQLFESLFASRTTPCRKLHRLAGSVIILDEAQTLPVHLLQPCLAALRELVADYGCTVVLCTATQPALDHRDEFPIGLTNVREIIPEPQVLAAAMRRVEPRILGDVSDDQLVDRLEKHSAWLAIVNTKAHAADLYHRLAGSDVPPDDLFHLSTLMCAQHRSEKLLEVKKRLKDGQPCRVVSTQLIEAGVDVDFPVVFRAMAGVDSIAQAAGRCNREGRLPGLGELYLFDPSEVRPHGYLGATAQTTRELLDDHPDPLDPAAVRRYFELHYWNQAGDHKWDDNRVMECFPEERGQFAYNFKSADERFQFIEETTLPVFVRYGGGAALIEHLRRNGPERWLLRKLQRYTVGLSLWSFRALHAEHDIAEVSEGYYALENISLYDPHRGLMADRPGFMSAESQVF